jgi:hypothetical protein
MSLNVNLLIKEAIANMPDSLNTKKEIDEYYKVAMKEINEKLKEEKKANKKTQTKDKAAPKKRVKKTAKPVEVDDDGNEIVKVKKPLNKYQMFIQQQRPKVKEDYPELSGEEIFKKIAELWKQHKEDINNGDGEPKKSDSEAEADEAKAAELAKAAEAYINSDDEDDKDNEAAEAAEADVKTTVVVEEKKEKPKEKKEKKPKKETS